jgi:hypothetical protein
MLSNIQQISEHGFKITHLLPHELKQELLQFMDNNPPSNSESWHLGGYRERWWLHEEQYQNLQAKLAKIFKVYTDAYAGDQDQYEGPVGFELWADHTGYENAMHHDDPNSVRNIIILYLGEESDDNTECMGTYWYEDDMRYEIPYKANYGLMLLHSCKIQHGMKGSVPIGTVRKALYINF